MSEHASEGMTFDQAQAAMQEAVSADPEFTPGLPADPSPQQAADPAPASGEPEPTPGEETDAPDPGATEFASPDADADSFMGADFNPDLLPEELQPGFKQLQAAFTRKTQELAEQRKEFETLGASDDLRQAKEFYDSLQDPEYLKAFYKELGGVVQEMGLVDDPAAPEPAEEPVAPELPAELAQIAESDPELQPFLDRFQQMEQRLQTFEQAQQEREQALQDERALMSQAAEIDRQVQAVREQHPEYGDEDWQAIYDRAVAFDGNVLQAAQAFQADHDRIIESYLAKKQTPTPAAPLPNPGTVTESTEEETMTLDQADRAAQAYLDANDLNDFVG